jgi:hypothetical protein
VSKYEILDVRTSRGVSRAMLFPKAILIKVTAPLREAMIIKRERLRAVREKRAAERPAKAQDEST